MMEVPKIIEKCTTKNPKYSKANTQVTSEKCAKFKKENDSKTTLKNQTNRNCKRPYPGVSKFFLPEKRARKLRTPKFLLGGSISDPLNLHSLQVRIYYSITSQLHLIRIVLFYRMNQN